MNTFTPERFFDTSSFKYREIFSNCEHVWEVLPLIKSFILSLKLGEIEGDVSDGAYLIDKDSISIGKGTVVEPGAYIKGPCVIGENCTIRQGAYIRGNFLCGDNCVIGHATEVKNCLFLNYAQAAHFAYVGDSVLGNRVNLGAGTKCANLRFDNRAVRLYCDHTHVNTGLRKFGAVFGDFSQSGCNSVTSPGTILCKHACIYPCVNAHGVIPESHVVKGDGSIVRMKHLSS